MDNICLRNIFFGNAIRRTGGHGNRTQDLFTESSLANEVERGSAATRVTPLGPASSNIGTIYVPTTIVWFTPLPVGVVYGRAVTPLKLSLDSLVVETNPEGSAVFSGLRCDECLLFGATDAHQVRRHRQASGACVVPALFGRRVEFVASTLIRLPATWAAWKMFLLTNTYCLVNTTCRLDTDIAVFTILNDALRQAEYFVRTYKQQRKRQAEADLARAKTLLRPANAVGQSKNVKTFLNLRYKIETN